MTLVSRRIRAGIVAGLVGGAAFAAVMRLDMRISGRRVDDFQLIGGIGPAAKHWRVTGPLLHACNSMALGAFYAATVHRLAGPEWARGVTFAIAENTALWPIVIALDRIHSSIQSGELEHFNRPWPFVAENLRHVAFGLTLGYLFPRLFGSSERHID